VTSRHPTVQRRTKPYLVNNGRLAEVFRRKFVLGFRRLVRSGKPRLPGPWTDVLDLPNLDEWLEGVTTFDWNVYIDGPPNGKSDPEHVLKYLARYLTGEPISDSRIIGDDGERVTFWARSKDKSAKPSSNRRRPFQLSGAEFVRRWAMHILPKGFTRTRCYGGYHTTKKKVYLEQCRQLLTQTNVNEPKQEVPPTEPIPESREPATPQCPRCQIEMICILDRPRPSWNEVFDRRSYSSHNMVLPVHGGGPRYVPDD
jgi:hypothetical protein